MANVDGLRRDMLKVLSVRAKMDAEPRRMLRAVLTRPVWRAVRLPVNEDVPARCWIVPGRAMPVIGRPVDVRGLDDAVLCPALIAVAVLNDVPGFGAVARISVSIGSSKWAQKHRREINIFFWFLVNSERERSKSRRRCRTSCNFKRASKTSAKNSPKNQRKHDNKIIIKDPQ